jgi:hypothetical protein
MVCDKVIGVELLGLWQVIFLAYQTLISYNH